MLFYSKKIGFPLQCPRKLNDLGYPPSALLKPVQTRLTLLYGTNKYNVLPCTRYILYKLGVQKATSILKTLKKGTKYWLFFLYIRIKLC